MGCCATGVEAKESISQIARQFFNELRLTSSCDTISQRNLEALTCKGQTYAKHGICNDNFSKRAYYNNYWQL